MAFTAGLNASVAPDVRFAPITATAGRSAHRSEGNDQAKADWRDGDAAGGRQVHISPLYAHVSVKFAGESLFGQQR